MYNSYREPNLWNTMPKAVKNLLIINALMFLITLVAEQSGINLNGILGLYYFDSPKFAFYQVFTYMFMHGGIGHIFFNMFALVMFGSIIENRWGTKRFLIYYLITGLGSGILYTVVNAIQLTFLVGSPVNDLNTLAVDTSIIQQIISIYYVPCVGASGALFGIMVAFAFLYPDAPLQILFIPIPIKAKYMVLGYTAIELFLGIKPQAWDNVAHFAHLGGALTGIIILLIWRRQGKLWGK